MSISSKTSALQAYHMVVYRNALHPEFFGIEGRKTIDHGAYEFEAWIFRGGHALRFEHGNVCAQEIVTELPERLPERGLLATLPCAGEKDHECEIGERVSFVTSMQTETLSDHLYLGTYNELYEHGQTCDGVMTHWVDESGKPNLSLIDTQRYNGEVHVQGYHLRGDCALVLRTQSIFQIRKPKVTGAK